MKRLILAGAGHAHALVLKTIAEQRWPEVSVTVISPEPLAPYSGMVPGWLAGLYRFEDIVVDFPPLVQAAGGEWLQGELLALDPARQRLTLTDGSHRGYDCLSLNVGSTLRPPQAHHAHILPLRPLSLLRQAYEPFLARWQGDQGKEAFVVTAVGGGAAGFESLLAVLQRLRQLRPDREVRGHLVTRGGELLPGLSAAARRAAQRALASAGVQLHLSSGWSETWDASSHLVLWATGAEAHDWQRDAQRRGALAVDASGFVQIDAQLRSVSHPEVFAVGDCASWPGRSLPKAGVHAVRMGPVLARNLLATLQGDASPLQTHRPQRHFLALLATGDGKAIASRGPIGAFGAWAWRWKDHIDRSFLRQFQRLAGAKVPALVPSVAAVQRPTPSGDVMDASLPAGIQTGARR